MVLPRTGLFWWMAASAVLMLVGALGPWARVLGLSLSGIDFGVGGFVLLAAVVVGVLLGLFDQGRLASRKLVIASGLLGLVSFAVTTTYLAQLLPGGSAGELFGEEVLGGGWGLVLAWLASASLVGATLVALRGKQGERRPAERAPGHVDARAGGKRPKLVTAAAVLLFVLGATLLVAGLRGLTRGAAPAPFLIALGLAVAACVAGVLVLRLKQAGRLLAWAVALVVAVRATINLIEIGPGERVEVTVLAGVVAIGFNVAIIVFLALEGTAFRTGVPVTALDTEETPVAIPSERTEGANRRG
jgi:hypothetical protein